MSTGDSAVWPMLMSADPRETIPDDMRASIEVAFVRPAPRWAPPPPRPSLKIVAAWLLFASSAIAALYMAHATGARGQEPPHADTAR